ncbi:MAG TPA: retropepsin-like aspartic protease [Gemmataceae bacterium]|jgi:hypothetical protein|nr:retropepsin-like aspartic protease [Gemmataceae bacterium]
MVPIDVRASHGTLLQDLFLIDTGADRTVLSAFFAGRLNLPVNPSPPGYGLVGISGETAFVLINTALQFIRTDGGPARVNGQFAAFLDTRATDYSVLGRDVLNNFDVIVSRRRNEVLLLAPNHQYQVTRA